VSHHGFPHYSQTDESNLCHNLFSLLPESPGFAFDSGLFRRLGLDQLDDEAAVVPQVKKRGAGPIGTDEAHELRDAHGREPCPLGAQIVDAEGNMMDTLASLSEVFRKKGFSLGCADQFDPAGSHRGNP
jgi:hypothetical protein